MRESEWIGASPPRREDVRLIRGQGNFVDDIRDVEALCVAFVRSPYAHAKVLSIDVDRAVGLPGVRRIVTASDLGEVDKPLMTMVVSPPPRFALNQPPLSSSVVRYLGEPLAAVLADDRYLAEDAAEAVAVEYEPLPVVADARLGLEPGAAVIHPAAGSNEVGTLTLATGDATQAFAQAHTVVEIQVEIGRSAGHPLETRGVLAKYDAAGDMLTIWTSTQVPHAIRTGLSEALARPEESIRVVAPDVGGAFGSKLILYPEEVLCAWLAIQTRRPVKWTEDRREHFLSAAHGRGQVHTAAMAVDGQGRILGVRDQFVHDNGAYTPYSLRVPTVTAKAIVGPYRVPHFSCTFRSAFTNKPPVIPYRGAGQPEAVFVIERLLDRAARELGLDPAEIRLRNLVTSAEQPYDTGVVYPGAGAVQYDGGDYPACLESVLQQIDLPAFRAHQTKLRAEGRYIGLGLSCYVESTAAASYEGAIVRVDNSGTVTIITGISSQGQGHETMLAQICAERLMVSMDRIRIRTGDTSLIPYGVGTWGSRAAATAGPAVSVAAGIVRDKATRVAATLLRVTVDDVVWEDGAVFDRNQPRRRLTLAELARASSFGRGPLLLEEGPGLEATHYFRPRGTTYASGAHAAVVEVDPDTCQVRIERYVIAHDCGRVINPAIVDGQMVGGVAQGVGGALFEDLIYDDNGQLMNASFMDYLLPTATDVPEVELHHLETLSKMNPEGFRGAGEGGILPGYAILVGAVEDAVAHLGVRIASAPVTPKLLHGLLGAGKR